MARGGVGASACRRWIPRFARHPLRGACGVQTVAASLLRLGWTSLGRTQRDSAKASQLFAGQANFQSRVGSPEAAYFKGLPGRPLP